MVTGSMISLQLREIAHRLDDAEIPWAVFAGAAVSVYTGREIYKDVDILIRCEDSECVSDLFPEASSEIRADGSVGCIALGGIEIVAGLTLYYTLEMDDDLISRIVRLALNGISVPVVSLEDNIAMKAMFDRGPKQGKHD
jgi:predicted nucleotidyltransferase